MSEDLESNSFFRILQSDFQDVWKQIKRQRLTVCVPQNKTLVKGTTIDKDYIEAHVLQDSPFFVGQFVSLAGDTINFNEEKGILVTSAGTRVPVLFEERFYNERDKVFKVWCIKHPLKDWSGNQSSGSGSKKSSSSSSTSSTSTSSKGSSFSLFSLGGSKKKEVEVQNVLEFPEVVTYSSAADFLMEQSGNEELLLETERSIDQFSESFVIVDGFISTIVVKAVELTEELVQRLISGNGKVFGECETSEILYEKLKQVAANYIAGKIHDKVWVSLVDIYRKGDGELQRTLEAARGLSQKEFGIERGFQGDQESAIQELAKLDGLTTPLEKMRCISTTMTKIGENVAKNRTGVTVTTDDLLPLFLHVMSRCGGEHMRSNLEYLLVFSESEEFISGAYGFYLVTFQAAVEFVIGSEFAQVLSRNGITVKKESRNRMMNNSGGGGGNRSGFSLLGQGRDRSASHKSRGGLLGSSGSGSMTSSTSTSSTSSLMTKSSSREELKKESGAGFQSAPKVIKTESGNLGSFLSSLKDDDDW